MSNKFFMASVGDHSEAAAARQEPERQHIVDLEELIREERKELPTINPNPCIFKIPQHIRDENPGAYTPCRVAIGPYHADTEHLKSMEPLKLEYLYSLISRSEGRSQLKDYTKAIEERHLDALQCHSGVEYLIRNQLDSQKFKKVLLRDGAFIVEFICRCLERNVDKCDQQSGIIRDLRAFLGGNAHANDLTYYSTEAQSHEVLSDLILLENQLPYFILEALFDCTFSGKNPIIFTLPMLAYQCLSHLIPIRDGGNLSFTKANERAGQETVMHLLHLMRMCCLDMPAPPRSLGENPSNTIPTSGIQEGGELRCPDLHLKLRSWWREKKRQRQLGKEKATTNFSGLYRFSATQLHEAGILFKRAKKGQFITIKFDEVRGVVEIPHLELHGSFEMFFRNVIAFEQYYLNNPQITNYICFMAGLIGTTKDMNILEQSHVIDNWLESKATSIFNVILNHTSTGYGEYKEVSSKLKAYTMKPWNRWKAMLRRDYFGSPWAIISFVAAVMLLALTALQTIATVRSTNWHS